MLRGWAFSPSQHCVGRLMMMISLSNTFRISDFSGASNTNYSLASLIFLPLGASKSQNLYICSVNAWGGCYRSRPQTLLDCSVISGFVPRTILWRGQLPGGLRHLFVPTTAQHVCRVYGVNFNTLDLTSPRVYNRYLFYFDWTGSNAKWNI